MSNTCKKTIDQSVPQIRQLNDPILHTAAKKITDFASSDIQAQLTILKRALYDTGGAGIATNQCLEIPSPLCMILAGVDYDHPDHASRVSKRYPNAVFLPMTCFINPRVLAVSANQVTFSEGCLSVKGVTRAEVLRPEWVKVEYADLNGNIQEKNFYAADARVMLHEIDHINHGYVYFQHVLNELNKSQLHSLLTVTEAALKTNCCVVRVCSFATPILLFRRDDDQKLTFVAEEVLSVFQQLPKLTLEGIAAKTREVIRL